MLKRQAMLIFSVFLYLAMAVDGTAAEDAVLQSMHAFELEQASDPQISPDSSRIVYVRHYADVMTDARYSNLWIVNADGSGHRALTTGQKTDNSPRWSPDGTRIAYIGEAEDGIEVHIRWMDT